MSWEAGCLHGPCPGWLPRVGFRMCKGILVLVATIVFQVLVAPLHPTLYDPMGCSLPGSSVHGILQARILALPCLPPGDLPNPGIKPTTPMSPALVGGFFTTEPPGKAPFQGQDKTFQCDSVDKVKDRL